MDGELQGPLGPGELSGRGIRARPDERSLNSSPSTTSVSTYQWPVGLPHRVRRAHDAMASLHHQQ